MVETSRDGRKWRTIGTAWTYPDEPILVHGASTWLRYRSTDSEEWSEPLERSGNECMALIDLNAGTRIELFPGDEFLGLPVLLPGGEAGRLLRFDTSDDGYEWNYALEFSGEVPARFR